MKASLSRLVPIALALGLSSSAFAQAWTEEQLDQRVQGFLEQGVLARLQQMGQLVAVQSDAGPAIAARIHGDHREYLLKVERLVDQLTDERWLERERAERELIEVGGRAGELLRQHAKEGDLLEERVRCERIIDEINARGTEKEEREIQILRGLVATALYLDDSPALTRALLSALGHTDPVVRQNAIRALAVHGRGDQVRAVVPMLDEASRLRQAALATIARMPGDEALRLSRELLESDQLTLTEKVAMMRALAVRDDARALMDAVAAGDEPALAAGAGIAFASDAGKQIIVRATLADRTTIEQPLLGITTEAVVLGSPVDGLPRIEVPFASCHGLEFPAEPRTPEAGTCRVFLTQGSLLTGRLVALDADQLQLETKVFGAVSIPRDAVQGVALDPDLDRLIGASTETDRLRLRDQTLVDSRILAIDGTTAKISGPDGGEELVAMQDIAGLLMTRPIEAPRDDNLYTRVDLVTGDRILGHLCRSTAAQLGVVIPEIGAAAIPLADVMQIEMEVAGGALWGFTLIADYSDNRLVEVDESGKEVFVMEDIYGAWDVECLDNGNLLITEFSVSRVQEVTRAGDTVWSYEQLRNPYDADRLQNGNTLIADTFRGRVLEVNARGETVWSYDAGIRPFDADRLDNGNTLIADVLKDRVIEVDASGNIVWQVNNLPSVHDADRLPNGNTLITLRTLNRVIEVDATGKELFRLSSLQAPSDADRLPNGHTLVAENNMVREFDRSGNVVWTKKMTWAVEVNRY